jgi:2-polyprenyl-3-methyl-5-hydroxy-6-metoxy-1,4-benzoquinol methylase
MPSRTVERGEDFNAFYAVRPASYYSGARVDLVDRLPRDASSRILEVGCGRGATGALALSEGCCGCYVGIESDDGAAADAREVLTDVIAGDIETIEPAWEEAIFDVLILPERFENLVDPDAALKKLAKFVRSGGMLLASAYNIAHWSVIFDLLLGKFRFVDRGGTGRTYSRRIAPEVLVGMLDAAGFTVDEISLVMPLGSKIDIVSKLTGGRFDHLFMPRITVVAFKR